MALDLSTLNGPQQEAVLTTEGPLLVLAGAGSGKTRVLTHRIAHLVMDNGVNPWEILAITFTNKAANEMKERLTQLIGDGCRGMWVMTFHKCCGRILRANAELIGFTENFTIVDDDDQKRLIKQILADLDYDEKRYQPKTILNIISSAKNDLVYPEDFAIEAGTPLEKTAAEVYTEYQKRLKANNAMDFDDMLMHCYTLLTNNPAVLAAYQDRFHYLLVDEYQDTNHVQYELCKLLAAKYKNIMVVGDDDQSIYSWRGADVRNILEFERDYKNCRTVYLEENYRSTGNILNAANAVIAKNKRRKAKRLFTSGADGALVGVYYAGDERDEGRWVAGEIDKAKKKGEINSYNDVAILYRTNAQSRVLEDMMLRAGIPYRIIGGLKFFDRKEIRDVMAYLSLVINNDDDLAFARIVNVPKRKIGKTTTDKIHAEAGYLQCSEFVAAEHLVGSGEISGQAQQNLAKFIMMIRDAGTYKGELKDVVEMIIDKSGIVQELEDQKTDEARERIENIKELLTVVEEFAENNAIEEEVYEAPTPQQVGEDYVVVNGVLMDVAETVPELVEGPVSAENVADGGPSTGSGTAAAPPIAQQGTSLADFIEWVRLRTDLDANDGGDQAVTLMTVHAAKGLEYEHVYVVGLEEGIFPGMRSIADEQELEEERRLAYVAFTRAKKKLTLVHAQSRRLYGMRDSNPASRFLTEIPSELRENLGIGSSGFEGFGQEKRGSRRGIAGSGTDYYNSGRVSNVSSSSQSRTSRPGSAPFKIGFQPNSKPAPAANSGTFAVNDIVEHKTFGRGRVVAIKGDRISIKFDRTHETKTLLRDYAPIVKVE